MATVACLLTHRTGRTGVEGDGRAGRDRTDGIKVVYFSLLRYPKYPGEGLSKKHVKFDQVLDFFLLKENQGTRGNKEKSLTLQGLHFLHALMSY